MMQKYYTMNLNAIATVGILSLKCYAIPYMFSKMLERVPRDGLVCFLVVAKFAIELLF